MATSFKTFTIYSSIRSEKVSEELPNERKQGDMMEISLRLI